MSDGGRLDDGGLRDDGGPASDDGNERDVAPGAAASEDTPTETASITPGDDEPTTIRDGPVIGDGPPAARPRLPLVDLFLESSLFRILVIALLFWGVHQFIFWLAESVFAAR